MINTEKDPQLVKGQRMRDLRILSPKWNIFITSQSSDIIEGKIVRACGTGVTTRRQCFRDTPWQCTDIVRVSYTDSGTNSGYIKLDHGKGKYA